MIIFYTTRLLNLRQGRLEYQPNQQQRVIQATTVLRILNYAKCVWDGPVTRWPLRHDRSREEEEEEEGGRRRRRRRREEVEGGRIEG